MPSHEKLGSDFVSIVVADSSRIHTKLLADALCNDRGLQVVASASNSEELLAAATRVPIDVVVISHNLDNQPGHGAEVLRKMRALRPQIKGSFCWMLPTRRRSWTAFARAQGESFPSKSRSRAFANASATCMKGRYGRGASIWIMRSRLWPTCRWCAPPITRESNSSPRANARSSST